MSIQTVVAAFQGVEGSFSHQALERIAPSLAALGFLIEQRPCQTFSEIFSAVETGAETFGVVPLENSSMGSIAVNADLLWHHSVVLAAEMYLTVHHNLIGVEGANIERISEVYSHPAALEQCRKFFAQYPNAKPTAYTDTSQAVLLVKRRAEPELAAIGSEVAANLYGLSILKKDIQDFTCNRTRFGVITRMDGALQWLKPAQERKVSVAVELEHLSGSLARFLVALAAENLNLTRCESRPIPEEPGSYRFFLDLDGITSEAGVASIKRCCQSLTRNWKFLGAYGSLGYF